MFVFIICFVCSFQFISCATLAVPSVQMMGNYQARRDAFLQEEKEKGVGSNLILDSNEQKLNQTLMSLKLNEMNDGFTNPLKFLPARSFLDAVDDIEHSEVFKILKKMPKGAVLHGHDTALVSADFVIKNLTYRENLYAKLDQEQNLLELRFFQNQPDEKEWKNVQEMRSMDGVREGRTFDEWLKTQISLGKHDVGLDVNSVWVRFGRIFSIITPMLTYEPVWKDHFYQALKEFHEDNINYLEFRGTLPNVYRLDGTELKEVEVCKLYVDTLSKFKKDYPSFYGARFIYAPVRHVNKDKLLEYARIARDLKNAFPDFVAGFDLVGQEDLGETLINFADELIEMQDKMNFYFHAGETNWNGFSTDDNLVDAVLLGTKRIGHGYAILKHPKVAQIVKTNNIGIELCPISNQVLGLVSDIRNHPGSSLLTNDFPVVIAPDDPGLWGAKGTTYDWYETFLGMAAKWQDLRLLKQLAINSINQTSLAKDQKEELYEKWRNQWNEFVDHINSGAVLKNPISVNFTAIICFILVYLGLNP